MDDRMKTRFSYFVAAVALTTSGCGYVQQSKFQMSLLPPTPHAASVATDIVAPPVSPSQPISERHAGRSTGGTPASRAAELVATRSL